MEPKDVKRAALLFASGTALSMVSALAEGPGKFVKDPARLVGLVRRAASRGTAFAAVHVLYTLLKRVDGLTDYQRRLAASLAAGYYVPPFLAVYFFTRGVVPPALRKHDIPPWKAWWVGAFVMNYQCWAAHHHFPRGYSMGMMKAIGVGDNAAIVHRSRTRQIVPCSDPVLGLHPGEASCVRAGGTALVRGVPYLLKCYGVLYALRVAAGSLKEPWHRVVTMYLRSVLMMAVQIHGGRSAYCIQSNVAPGRFLPWLGPICGFAASNGLRLERAGGQMEVVTFNIANVIATFISMAGLGPRAKHLFAALFAIGSASSGRLFQ